MRKIEKRVLALGHVISQRLSDKKTDEERPEFDILCSAVLSRIENAGLSFGHVEKKSRKVRRKQEATQRMWMRYIGKYIKEQISYMESDTTENMQNFVLQFIGTPGYKTAEESKTLEQQKLQEAQKKAMDNEESMKQTLQDADPELKLDICREYIEQCAHAIDSLWNKVEGMISDSDDELTMESIFKEDTKEKWNGMNEEEQEREWEEANASSSSDDNEETKEKTQYLKRRELAQTGIQKVLQTYSQFKEAKDATEYAEELLELQESMYSFLGQAIRDDQTNKSRTQTSGEVETYEHLIDNIQGIKEKSEEYFPSLARRMIHLQGELWSAIQTQLIHDTRTQMQNASKEIERISRKLSKRYTEEEKREYAINHRDNIENAFHLLCSAVTAVSRAEIIIVDILGETFDDKFKQKAREEAQENADVVCNFQVFEDDVNTLVKEKEKQLGGWKLIQSFDKFRYRRNQEDEDKMSDSAEEEDDSASSAEESEEAEEDMDDEKEAGGTAEKQGYDNNDESTAMQEREELDEGIFDDDFDFGPGERIVDDRDQKVIDDEEFAPFVVEGERRKPKKRKHEAQTTRTSPKNEGRGLFVSQDTTRPVAAAAAAAAEPAPAMKNTPICDTLKSPVYVFMYPDDQTTAACQHPWALLVQWFIGRFSDMIPFYSSGNKRKPLDELQVNRLHGANYTLTLMTRTSMAKDRSGVHAAFIIPHSEAEPTEEFFIYADKGSVRREETRKVKRAIRRREESAMHAYLKQVHDDSKKVKKGLGKPKHRKEEVIQLPLIFDKRNLEAEKRTKAGFYYTRLTSRAHLSSYPDDDDSNQHPWALFLQWFFGRGYNRPLPGQPSKPAVVDLEEHPDKINALQYTIDLKTDTESRRPYVAFSNKSNSTKNRRYDIYDNKDNQEEEMENLKAKIRRFERGVHKRKEIDWKAIEESVEKSRSSGGRHTD